MRENSHKKTQEAHLLSWRFKLNLQWWKQENIIKFGNIHRKWTNHKPFPESAFHPYIRVLTWEELIDKSIKNLLINWWDKL